MPAGDENENDADHDANGRIGEIENREIEGNLDEIDNLTRREARRPGDAVD